MKYEPPPGGDGTGTTSGSTPTGGNTVGATTTGDTSAGSTAGTTVGTTAGTNGGGSTSGSTGSGTGTSSGTTGPDAEAPMELGPLGLGAATLDGTNVYGNDDGPRGTARFRNPVNTAIAPDGKIIVADFDNGLLRTLTPDGMVSTLTSQANFTRPFGLAFTPDGKLWVQTDRNELGEDKGALWVVDRTTGVATVVESGIGRPRGMAALSDGRIVMAFYVDHVVRIYNPAAAAGSRLSLLAGTAGTPGFADATGTAAAFAQPYDVAVLPGDVVIVSDLDNHRLRKVGLDGAVSTFLGDGVAESRDGARTGGLATARVNGPQGLAVDGNGTLYVTEVGGYHVRKLAADTLSTIGGDGTAGFADDTDPLKARFYGLEGLDVSPDGRYVYVADGDRGNGESYHRVRRIDLGP